MAFGDLWSCFSMWVFSSWHRTRLCVCTLLVPTARLGLPFPSFLTSWVQVAKDWNNKKKHMIFTGFLQGVRTCLSFFCKSNSSCFLSLKWEYVLKMEMRGLQVSILWPEKHMGERILYCCLFKWLALGIFPKSCFHGSGGLQEVIKVTKCRIFS